MRTISILAVAALLCAPLSSQVGRGPRPLPQGGTRIQNKPPAPFLIRCTPKTIDTDGKTRQVRNPIKEALELAGPGTLIRLGPGDYPGFGIGFDKPSDWNARTAGGNRNKPIVVAGEARVRIVPGDRGDTISINQAVKNQHITFKNLTVVPGYRAGIFFFKLGSGTHRGYKFYDVNIEGSWDHVSNRGANSKWGLWAHSLENFEFVGKTRRSVISKLRYEHAFYIQNIAGDVLIENVEAHNLGRTFCQFTARVKDGQPGRGNVTIRNCDVRDIGISKDDGYKGGSAFTIAGRMEGRILLEGNRYRAGFDPRLRKLTKQGRPYGTGAVAIWDGHEPVRNAHVVLKDNDFRFSSGCGDRPVVSIGGCDRVELLGHNVFVGGSDEIPALDLDPMNRQGLQSKANGEVHVAAATDVDGWIKIRGRKASRSDLSSLAVPLR